MNNWPVKSWEDEDAYMHLLANDVHPHQLAWEFLRRNKSYQRSMDSFLAAWDDELQANPDYTQDGPKGICLGGVAHECAKVICEKYGIIDTVPTRPDNDYPPNFICVHIWSYNANLQAKSDRDLIRKAKEVLPRNDAEVLVRLNLNLPINDQLHKIERSLKSLTQNKVYKQLHGIGTEVFAKSRREIGKRTHGKNGREFYIRYLRLLDAVDVEPIPKRIYLELYQDKPNPKVAFYNDKHVAERLRDEDFLSLLP
jgi:hypothetical protein